jgi:hypothetical protein
MMFPNITSGPVQSSILKYPPRNSGTNPLHSYFSRFGRKTLHIQLRPVLIQNLLRTNTEAD